MTGSYPFGRSARSSKQKRRFVNFLKSFTAWFYVCTMKPKRRPPTSYTPAEIMGIAIQFTNQTDFHNKARSAKRAAKILGCYEACTAHMTMKQRPKGYWTIELCKREALKFESRFEFFKHGSAAYQAANKRGWLDEICSHMPEQRKEKGYWWQEENLVKEGSKYDCRSDFQRAAPRACEVATFLGIYEDICSHMDRKGNASNKLIYAFEFPDKHAYVGLTFSVENRQKHRKQDLSDPVNLHTEKTGLIPELRVLTPLMPVAEAALQEKRWLEQYKNEGWKMLNKAAAGAVGGTILMHTKERCLAIAKSCQSRKEFYETHASAYGSALANGWLSECYRLIPSDRKLPGHWCKENILLAALTCKTRSEFERKFPSAHTAAVSLKIIPDVLSHIPYVKLPNNTWTFDRISAVAQGCDSPKQFLKEHRNAYQRARAQCWLERLYNLMGWIPPRSSRV